MTFIIYRHTRVCAHAVSHNVIMCLYLGGNLDPTRRLNPTKHELLGISQASMDMGHNRINLSNLNNERVELSGSTNPIKHQTI